MRPPTQLLTLRSTAFLSVGKSARSFHTTPRRPIARMTIVGRLADAPELHSTSTGNDIIKYAIASGSGPRDNRQTSWWKVVSFAKDGPRERLLGLAKGTLVYIDADATLRKLDSSDGRPSTIVNLIERKLEVLKRPTSDGRPLDESVDQEE